MTDELKPDCSSTGLSQASVWAALVLTLFTSVVCAPDEIVKPDPLPPETFVPDSVFVSITIDPDTVAPGRWASAYLRAFSNKDETRLTFFGLRISYGVGDTTVSIPIDGTGAQFAEFQMRFPQEVLNDSLYLTAFAYLDAVGDSVTEKLWVNDLTPPVVSIAPMQEVLRDGWFAPQVFVEDNAGISTITALVSGASVRNDSLSFSWFASWEGNFPVQIPVDAFLGDSVVIRVIATDMYGLTSDSSVTAVVTERNAPVVRARIDSISSASERSDSLLLALNDTTFITITVVEDEKLEWIGYRTGGLSDSVMPTSRTEDSLKVPLTPGLNVEGGYQSITFFARDSAGNMGVTSRHLVVLPAWRVPYVKIPHQGCGRPSNAVYDPKRNRLYHGPQCERSVSVLDMATGAVEKMSSSFWPGRWDLTPSYDSLIVVEGLSPYLRIFDLTQTPARMDSLRVGEPGFDLPTHLTIDAGNRIWISTTDYPHYPPDGQYLIDLNTGVETIVNVFPDQARMYRSFDGGVIFGMAGDGMTRLDYSTGDAISASVSVDHGGVALDSTGSVAVLNSYEDVPKSISDRMEVIASFPFGSQVTGISLDGKAAYGLPEPYSYYHPDYGNTNLPEFIFPVFETLTGALMVNVVAPAMSTHFIPIPNTKRLIVFSDADVIIYDLSSLPVLP